MNDKQKNYAIYAVFVILVLVAGYFGVKLPMPPVPDPLAQPAGASAALASGGLSVIRLGQDVVMNQDLSVAGNETLTGNATVGGTLGVTGVTTLAANLEANGGITVDSSNFTVNGTSGAVSTASTVYSAGDITAAADSTGGDQGAKTEISGLPRVKLVATGTGTNPGSQTISLFDDTPDGEYAPIDADVTETASTAHFKYGSKSYKAAFAATAASGDGIVGANVGAGAAWDDMESCGLLIYSSATLAAGDLTLVLTDDGGARTFNIPAVTDVNKWTWVEVDISTGDLSAVSDVAIKLSAAGATAQGAFDLYVDIGYVWDSADEEALGTAILQDGVLSVMSVATAAGSSNTPSMLAELTDYLVHYENGNDFIVWITDQSASSNVALVAY